jgi:hypothetical protein
MFLKTKTTVPRGVSTSHPGPTTGACVPRLRGRGRGRQTRPSQREASRSGSFRLSASFALKTEGPTRGQEIRALLCEPRVASERGVIRSP